MLYFEIYSQMNPKNHAFYYTWVLMNDTEEKKSYQNAPAIEGDFMDMMRKVGDKYLNGNWKQQPPVFRRPHINLSSTQKQAEEKDLEDVKRMLRGP